MSDSSQPIQLADVLITEELARRKPRQPDLLAENEALRSLAQQLAHAPDQMLQRLVELARELCNADTAGVSLIETQANGQEVFRWGALAGALADQVGGCVSRHFSPCGVCLEQATPVLFAYPERYFTALQQANLPMPEMLVLPLVVAHQPLGTLWLVAHDEGRRFDAEDVRLMTGLADFTVATLQRHQQQTKALQVAHTALQQASTDRQRAEEQALALVENLPGGAAFVVDRDLRYAMAAGEALEAANFQPEDFVGRTIFEVLPPELAAPDDERVVEQAALLEVGDEGSRRLVDAAGHRVGTRAAEYRTTLADVDDAISRGLSALDGDLEGLLSLLAEDAAHPLDGLIARWLSQEEAILNPYYGASMLRCGSVELVVQ